MYFDIFYLSFLMSFLVVLVVLSLVCAHAQECKESHSQSGEENAMISHFFKDMKNGFYIEMGALDGVTYSNTLKLHSCKNWSGILIEGSKGNFEILQKNVALMRPENVVIHHAAICAPPSFEVAFDTGSLPAVSGDIAEMAPGFLEKWHNNGRTKVSKTPCAPMSEFLKNTAHVDFFSLDVEGAELTVLETIDFNKVDISTFMIELDEHSPHKNYKIRQYLFNMGYVECMRVVSRSGTFIHKKSPFKCPFETSVNASHLGAVAIGE
jgi:FkbM family methyltransferase